LKRILIDINSAVLRRGETYLSGIGRATNDLVTGLNKLEPLPVKIILYFQNITGNADFLNEIKFRKIQLPFPRKNLFMNLANRFRIKEILSGYDLLHIPHNYSKVIYPEKTVLTLHDAMFFSYPEDFLGHEYARNHYPELARSCKAIATCSESSKSDIVKFMDIPPEKIAVIPWGVSKEYFYPESRKIVEEFLLKIGLERPFFLMVSCDIGRKNTISLLKSFRLFLQSKPEHDLVLVWNKPPQKILSDFSAEINNRRIHIIKGVENNQLRYLYCGATASFFPSRYEGFGLPVIESMACGTPVVTCRNSALTEVGGDVAYYTDPDEPGQMSDYMKQFENGLINTELEKSRCLDRAAKFDWSVTAYKYVEFYQQNVK
jgi:glycosyltransferase involved in cell wall biosynthesis